MAHTRAMIQGEMDQTRRLPAEILEFVFMHLKLSDPNSDAGFDAEWIKVTWVCGRWRQIALQCSALWAVTAVMERPGASSDPFDAARTLLERASPRPLTLVAVTPPALQVLRPHAHRVRSLTLQIRPWHLTSEFSTTQAIQAVPNLGTILTRLLLSGYKGHLPWHPERYQAPEFPSVTLHANAFPHLRFLEVEDVALDIVGQMINLEIFRGAGLSEITGREQDLKGILKAMPNVRCIDLDNFIPDPDIVSDQPELSANIPVVLPKLEVLQISELAYDIPILLGMISIPPTARVLITGYFYGAYPSCMLDEIFPLDFDPFGCFKETSTLSIEVSPEGHVCTLGMGEKLQRRTLLWAIKAMELIDQRNDPSEAAIMEHIGQCFSTVLEDVLRIVPPLQLTRLQLRMPSTIPVSQDLDLTRWLRHFTNLQCLDIKGSALSRTIVDVLKTDPQLLPCLKVVVLYLDTAETVPRADALEQWTLGRARAGSALDGVFIGPSNQEVFTRTLVGTLQQLLESVAKHVGRTHMVNPAGQPMRVG